MHCNKIHQTKCLVLTPQIPRRRTSPVLPTPGTAVAEAQTWPATVGGCSRKGRVDARQVRGEEGSL
jgi:hypothetical protein